MLLFKKNLIHLLTISCSVLLLVVLNVGKIGAEPALITQGFQADESNISTGAIVSLKEDSADTVELGNVSNAERLAGVVSESAFLEVSDDASSVQVVTNGTVSVLVSDLNGEVKVGDRIAPSPLAGVGMRATQSGVVLGSAQGDFGTTTTVERTLTDQNGDTQSVRIGLVPAQVNVAAYIVNNQSDGAVPSFLQDFANSVAGRSVSPTRVLVATLLVVLLFVSVTVLLYSAVRSSIISIGRNPLSESALRRSLWQVGLTVGGIVVTGLLAVFLVLKV